MKQPNQSIPFVFRLSLNSAIKVKFLSYNYSLAIFEKKEGFKTTGSMKEPTTNIFFARIRVAAKK